MLSVVTIVRNRNRMLSHFLRGWAAQTDAAPEIVVVHTGGDEDPADVVRSRPDLDVRVVGAKSSTPDGHINYSVARNAGAAAAAGEHLLFCDADTIPLRHVARRIDSSLADVDALLTADVRYLPPDAELGLDPDELVALGRRHPHRPPPPSSGIDLHHAHHLVWGLCMAIRRSTFDEIGGFDEGYDGYAGEDTDLAEAVRRTGRSAGIVAGCVVLHQHHDSWEPPLHQMEATVANAQRYRLKWGTWPMTGWLAEFERLGLIEREEHRVVVRRTPTDDEIEAHRCVAALPFRGSLSEPVPIGDRPAG